MSLIQCCLQVVAMIHFRFDTRALWSPCPGCHEFTHYELSGWLSPWGQDHTAYSLVRPTSDSVNMCLIFGIYACIGTCKCRYFGTPAAVDSEAPEDRRSRYQYSWVIFVIKARALPLHAILSPSLLSLCQGSRFAILLVVICKPCR